MKASVKLREGKQPLVRAKLPARLLGVPLLSGISLGSTEELGLHVGTLFDTGPSWRLTYRPNDAGSPFSLLIKTGLRQWGSPTDAALIMAAEFNLSSKGTPSFAVQVKPRLGNFSVRKDAVSPPWDCGSKKHSEKMIAEVHHVDREQDRGFVDMEDFSEKKKACSVLGLGAGSGVDERLSTLGGDSEVVFGSNYLFKVEGKGVSVKNGGSVSPPSSEGSSVVLVNTQEEDEEEVALNRPPTGQQAFEADLKPVNFQNTIDVAASRGAGGGGGDGGGGGWNLIAHTTLPLGRHTVANVRWRVRMGSDLLHTLQSEPESFSLRRLPVLVVDKLSLECREDGGRPRSSSQVYDNNNMFLRDENRELGRVASICSSMKRQLQLLYVENRVLRKTMEDMKAEISSHRRGRHHLAMDDDMQRELFSSQARKDQNLMKESFRKPSEESVDESAEQQQHQFELKGLGPPPQLRSSSSGESDLAVEFSSNGTG